MLTEKQQKETKRRLKKIYDYIKSDVNIFDSIKFNIPPLYNCDFDVILLVVSGGFCSIIIGQSSYSLNEDEENYLLKDNKYYNVALNLISEWVSIKKYLDKEKRNIDDIDVLLDLKDEKK